MNDVRPSPTRTIGRRELVATGMSAALVVLAFPQFGSAWGLDPLIWIAFVPFFRAAVGRGARAGVLLGVLLGIAVEGSGFLWVFHAIRSFTGLPAALAALGFTAWIAYSALPWAALGIAAGRARHLRSVGWVIPFWVALEHYFPRLWPWDLGVALYDRAWLSQVADIFGTSGLSALVLVVNLTIARLWGASLHAEPRPRATMAVTAALLIAAVVYGAARESRVREYEEEQSPLDVLLVQGAIPLAERARSGLSTYLARSRRALAESAPEKPALVVWPEGSMSQIVSTAERFYSLDVDLESARPLALFLRHRLDPRELDVPLVANARGFDGRRQSPFSNLNVYFSPGEEPVFYEKIKRVPFGEVVPGIELLPDSLRESWGLLVGTLAAGNESPVCDLGGRPFRHLICYEAVLPSFVRRYAGPVEFFVNTTEDVWYGRTAHIPQHVAVIRLRAIENRVPIVRCANLGPSGIATMRGEFLGGARPGVPELVRAELRPGRLWTLYGSGGHLFPLVCAVLVCARYVASRKKRREIQSSR